MRQKKFPKKIYTSIQHTVFNGTIGNLKKKWVKPGTEVHRPTGAFAGWAWPHVPTGTAPALARTRTPELSVWVGRRHASLRIFPANPGVGHRALLPERHIGTGLRLRCPHVSVPTGCRRPSPSTRVKLLRALELSGFGIPQLFRF